VWRMTWQALSVRPQAQAEAATKAMAEMEKELAGVKMELAASRAAAAAATAANTTAVVANAATATAATTAATTAHHRFGRLL